MSSIYKKGRDGYYYYQAYIYNPITKKKDKRIFRALGTKDYGEAKSKQIKFDNEYENSSKEESRVLNTFNKFSLKSYAIIFLATIIFIISSNRFFDESNEKMQTLGLSTSKNNSINPEKKSKPFGKGVIDDLNLSSKSLVETKVSAKIIKNDIYNDEIEDPIIIPKYTVERVIKVSGVFNQGKIFVTTEKRSSNESQRLL